jgi:hypothetical protein
MVCTYLVSIERLRPNAAKSTGSGAVFFCLGLARQLAAALLPNCGRGDRVPSNSNFLMDRMQVYLRVLILPVVIAILSFRVVQVVEACTQAGSVGCYNLIANRARLNIFSGTTSLLYYGAAPLSSRRGGYCMPLSISSLRIKQYCCFFYPIGSGTHGPINQSFSWNIAADPPVPGIGVYVHAMF